MEKTILDVEVTGKESLKELEASIGKIGKTTGKTQTELQKLKKELIDSKNAMMSAVEGSDEYNRALTRAAKASFDIRDANSKIKASVLDFGETAKNVGGAISGLAGGFAAAQGAIGLMGIESEKTEKFMQNMLATLSVSQGLANFMDAFQNMKDLYKGVKANIAALTIVKQAETVVTIENTAANVAEAAAVTGVGVATQATSKSMMAALGPYALVAVAVGAVAAAVVYLIQKMNEVPAELELNISLNEEAIKKEQSGLEKLRLFAVEYNEAVRNGNENRIKQLEEIALKEYGVHKDRLKQIGENVNSWKKAFEEYLIIAKIAYHNEALAKKKSEVEVQQEIQTGNINFAKKKLKELKDRGVTDVFTLKPFKDSIQESSKKMYVLNQQMAELNRVAFQVYAGKKDIVPVPEKTTTEKRDKSKTPGELVAPATPLVDVKKRKSDNEIILGLNRDLSKGMAANEAEAFKLNEEMYSNGLESYEQYLKNRIHLLEIYGGKQSEIEKEQTLLTIEQIDKYSSAIGSVANFMSGLAQDEMEINDNKLKKQQNNLELSQEYRQADSEKQQQMMYELELANYEKNKKMFEANKAFQIAAVITEGVSNEMKILANLFDPKTGGPTSPINIAVAAASTLANTLTTVQSVRKIASTSLDAPVPPGGGNSVASINAVAPTQSSTTTREENLNTSIMNSANKSQPIEVKVSDINKAQKVVSVRDNNTSY